MSLRLLLAFALLPLAACGDADDTVVTDDVDVVAVEPVVEPMDDPGMDEVTAQGTLDAVTSAGGLTSLAPEAAVANIDAWIAKLDGMDATAPVVEGLQTLRGQLTTTPLDGAAIGGTLVMLGEQTTGAAGEDAALQQLGDALTAAGTTLQGD